MTRRSGAIQADRLSRPGRARAAAARWIAIGLAGLMLAGCAGADFRTDWQRARDRAETYIAAHPALSAETRSAIRLARLQAGMSKDEVIAAWGRPVLVQRDRDGRGEYWYFGCHWPHSCSYPDEDTDFPLPGEVYESQAAFRDGRLVDWRH